MASLKRHQPLKAVCTLVTVLGLSASTWSAEFAGGTGEPNDPYLIATAEQLLAIGSAPTLFRKHFLLTTDIDLSECPDTGWNVIGTKWNPFLGVFDGDGHTISHLTYDSNATDYVGLFGSLGYWYFDSYRSPPSPGTIRNLGLVDVDIRGGDYVGALAGQNGGRIVNCYVTGSVRGEFCVGPVTGSSGGHVTNCYAMARATGSQYVGGLIGNNDGTVAHCYSIGPVSGSEYVGGLVGAGTAAVESFWDIDASGLTISAGGRGKTSEQMGRKDTYVGWNGNAPAVWTLDEGRDYPRLAWEGRPGWPIPAVHLGDFLPGKGVEGNPYLVSNAQQLNAIGLFASQWDRHFLLTADIDLSPVPAAEFNIIGVSDANAFTGRFDGDGHRVSGLRYNTPNAKCVGLFGSIGADGRVVNLEVSDVNVTGGWCVGGLAGHVTGQVSGCRVTGAVTGDTDIGGLVGTNQGDIDDCHADVTILGSMAGGLVGANFSGHLLNCSAAGQVRGTGALGGLAGFNVSTIRQCFSTADVTSTYEGQGIVNPYATRGVGWTGPVAKVHVDGVSTFVGGLVGFNDDSAYDEGGIFSCYATGRVYGTEAIGGLAGFNWGPVSDCYAVGAVSGSTFSGGLVGAGYGKVKSSYWDSQTTGQTASAGGEARTTEQMCQARTYWGWNDCSEIWVIDEGQTPPTLAWQNAVGQSLPYLDDLLVGSGTAREPWQIATVDDLRAVTCFACQWDKHFVLMADLDLSALDSAWPRIGVSDSQPFQGTFDGRGHSLSHLVVGANNMNNAGLFGVLGPDGAVKDLHLPDCHITGRENVGALAGSSQGTVSGCSVSGEVSGRENVGGLIGSASGPYGLPGGQVSECSVDGTVKGSELNAGGLIGFSTAEVVRACYATATVDGNCVAGGLVGENAGLIRDCYARGPVSGSDSVGGLVGESQGTIQSAYATGLVQGGESLGGLVGGWWDTDAMNSFWDIQTTGLALSGGGRGRTTEQMKQAETYLGWNTDGCVTWTIDEGIDYPHLAWEAGAGQPIPLAELGDFLAGQGTASEPYVIAAPDQFNMIGLFPSQWQSHFVLDADLDFAGHDADGFNRVGAAWSVPFDGVLEGGDHAIRNFTLSLPTTDRVGLLGHIGQRGRVRNLHLVDVNVVGVSRVGALAGRNSGQVENCSVTGDIQGRWAGGLLGDNRGTVSYCNTDVKIHGSHMLGGLAGSNNSDGLVFMSGVSGEIRVPVTEDDWDADTIGGLVGENTGTVCGCAADVTITGGAYWVGGLLGVNGGTVSFSYARGLTQGRLSVGGLIGTDFGFGVHGCYAAGVVEAAEPGTAGGLVGDGGGPEAVSDSFWDVQVSGQAQSDGGQPLQTAQMQDLQTYLAAGWDFVLADDGPSDIWAMPADGGYPILWWQMAPLPPLPTFAGGRGTYMDPYLITDADSFNQIGYHPQLMDKAFRLVADLDLSGMAGCPIGHPYLPFTGVFDGRGHVIEGFTCASNDANDVGLFRYVGLHGVVKDLGLLDVAISGRDRVGGLAGYSRGTLAGCHVSGAVRGTQSVGGLAGGSAGTVVDCYTTALVDGYEWVDGSVGCFNRGRITRCYAAGPVTGFKPVEGAIGYTEAQRTCFYDIQATGQPQSYRASGKTTAEMQDIRTFQDAGWDFIGPSDGLSDVWAMPPGGGYPVLWWEVEPIPIVPAFAGGNGTPEDPYLIAEPGHLASIWANPRLMDCCFCLIENIDLSDVSFHPIGDQDTPYNGTFDGRGLSISNLLLDVPTMDGVGLFGRIGHSGCVTDLDVKDAAVLGNTGVGVVAGLNDGSVSRCRTSGTVSGMTTVGGVVGWNRLGTVTNCDSTATVSSEYGDTGQIMGRDLNSEY